ISSLTFAIPYEGNQATPMGGAAIGLDAHRLLATNLGQTGADGVSFVPASGAANVMSVAMESGGLYDAAVPNGTQVGFTAVTGTNANRGKPLPATNPTYHATKGKTGRARYDIVFPGTGSGGTPSQTIQILQDLKVL